MASLVQLAGLLLTLVALQCTLTSGSTECEGGPRLAQQIKQSFQSGLHIQREIRLYTGLDIGDMATRRMIACALIEANTLEELAEMLNTPLSFLSHYQKIMVGAFIDQKTGLPQVESMQELLEYFEERKRLQARLDEWQRHTGYPRFPLRNTNRQEIEQFFTELQRDFPDIYGDSVTPLGMRSHHLPVDISHDPAELAEFLSTSTSQSELLEHFYITRTYFIDDLRLSVFGKSWPYMFYGLYQIVSAMVETGAIDFLSLDNNVAVPATSSELQVTEDCEYIYRLVHQLLQMEEDKPNMYLVPAMIALQSVTDTNFLDDTQLLPLACRLSEVRSVAELAKLVTITGDELQNGYDGIPEEFNNMIGGMQNVISAHHHLTEVRRFCQRTDFPIVPVDVTEAEMSNLIEEHIRPLVNMPTVNKPWPMPPMDVFFPLDRFGSEELYQIYAGSHTLSELQYNIQTLYYPEWYYNFCPMVSMIVDGLDLAIPAAQRLQQMGIPLPIDIPTSWR